MKDVIETLLEGKTTGEKLEFLRDFGEKLEGVKKVERILEEAKESQTKLNDQDDEFTYGVSTWENRMGPGCTWTVTTTTKKKNKDGEVVAKKVETQPYPGMGGFPESVRYYDADDNEVPSENYGYKHG